MLDEFHRLRAADQLTVADICRLAGQAAETLMAHHQATEGYLREAGMLLCEAATLPDETLAEAGSKQLFALIEQLSDSFAPQGDALYERLFAQALSCCRALPGGEDLDRALRRFGLESEEAIWQRAQRVGQAARVADMTRQGVRKVLIPSRVTFGADVAVTSVIIGKAKQLFPQANIVLLGLRESGQLFAGDSRVRLHPVGYGRGGHLLKRLSAWLDLLRAVDQEREGLGPGEYWVIDPDSRLTQLGMLPLIEDETRYRFFPSRSFQRAGLDSLGQLTAAWLDETFGGEAAGMPNLALSPADPDYGQRVRALLRRCGVRHLATVSFGVGGNDCKRIGDAFELELVIRLIAQGSTVLLARGVGTVELERSEWLTAHVLGHGKRVAAIWERNEPDTAPLCPNLVTWRGELGAFCGLIAASDLYIGYDSAGQHIAAALGMPAIDIFVDCTYPLMAKRWRPTGSSIVQIVEAAPGESETDLQARILACYHQIRGKKE
jgi:hypothetical protein